MSHCAGQRYQAPAHTYYVDTTTGSSTATGTSEHSPYQTLTTVAAIALKPGDRVLFKRGETWKNQSIDIPSSGKYGSPIYFGTYGSGSNPVIDPTLEQNDFALDSGVIWKRTDTGNDPQQVFEDGVRMTYAAASAGLAAGSWCRSGNVLYVRATDDGNPNTGHVTEYVLAANTYVIDINGKSHLVFDGIDVTKTNYSGYICRVVGTRDLTIQNCNVSWGARSILIGTDGNVTWTYPMDVRIRNVVAHDDLDVPFWIGHGSRLSVEDCEVYNSGKDVAPGAKNYPAASHYPDGILISAEGYDCVVRGNYVHDIYYGQGILDEQSLSLKPERTIIEGNWVDTTSTCSPAVMISGCNTLCRNNVLITCSGNAIILSNSPLVPLIYNNTMISTSGAAHTIDTNGMPGAVIKNNIFVRAGTTNRYLAVAIAAKTNIVINNNLYYGADTHRWFWGPSEYTSLATWQSAASQDANALVGDPAFAASPTNLHLQASSSAIAHGDNTLGVTIDYDGVVRGATVDIGAFQYV